MGWSGVVVLALAGVMLVVAAREVLGIRLWRRRCAAVLEPGKAGAYFGRCELRAGHRGNHHLERGMDVVEFTTARAWQLSGLTEGAQPLTTFSRGTMDDWPAEPPWVPDKATRSSARRRARAAVERELDDRG